MKPSKMETATIRLSCAEKYNKHPVMHVGSPLGHHGWGRRMFKSNLKGQVRQTLLPKWRPLLPLFEAVVNAFQAIQESPRRASHHVVVEIERDHTDLLRDDRPQISGFKITDTGVGFNAENFDSFNTSYSDYKLDRGGKGLGRIMWLKAFSRVEIDSVFVTPDSDGAWRRAFTFNEGYTPGRATANPVAATSTGTSVRLVGFKEPYRSECPDTAEQIAHRLIEHILLLFLQKDCPMVDIHDLGERLSVNEVFERDFKALASSHTFSLNDVEFKLHGFRIMAPRVSKHRLVYAANCRGVVSDNLKAFIPNLSGRLNDSEGNSFVYLAVVQSPYLDLRVNNARTDFDINHEEDAEVDQPSLLGEEISRSEIREACVKHVQQDLADTIQEINAAKEARIIAYVEEEAPQYKILMRYLSEFVSQIPPAATKADIEASLHRELFQREVKMKQEGSRIIKEADKIENYEEYQKRISDFMNKYNELGVSALAQYVGHRKIILDFLDRAISRDQGNGKYPLEKAVHHLVFPMRTTSEDIPYYQQNLWLIDERLTYHSFISSDVPFSQMGAFDCNSADRPDMFIFDRKIAFAEGEQPISSIVVVEFKRPQRNDYKANDNPLSQSFDMIENVRAGKFLDQKGRPISVASDQIPAYCYVICDITPSLQKVLLDMDGAEITPDRQGYYGYHRRRRVYYEVIDYNKLLRDAQKRNRIFFEKLNILGNR
ncbi:ATP-binding protein [Azospirillum sp. Vi22]|uniref:ATP-binding protein n=1 Tax=Azospirillum baldaniorum TaxID=1064539 RepID=UPI00157A9B32|nr:ATP-binding protein [Azospirillum baldaniorum]NUB05804.1 ATP-binding protein [Azospirillum baldaniorum]